MAYKRDYYQEHREEVAAYGRRYYEEHREERAAWQHRWNQEHREQARANRRRWRENNRKRMAASQARRKARKQALPDTLLPKERSCLLAIGQATYPGEELHLDHVVPLSKGGGTTRANCHYIPAGLNCSKQDALPKDVYGQMPLLFGAGEGDKA